MDAITPASSCNRKKVLPFPVSDGRSWQSRHLRAMQDSLLTQVGPSPTPIQLQMIGRAAVLSLHLAILDRENIDKHVMTTDETSKYHQWQTALDAQLQSISATCAPFPHQTRNHAEAA